MIQPGSVGPRVARVCERPDFTEGTMAIKKKTTTKAVEIQQAETSAAVKRVAGLNPEATVKSVTEAQLQVASTFSEIQKSVASEFAKLQDVQTAVAAKQAQLSELLGIEGEALSLDEVKKQREAEEAAFEAEIAERDAKREQEEKDYDYDLARKRRLEADQYADTIKARNKAQAEQEAAKKAELDRRESEIKAQEAEINNLRAQVATIPDEIKKAVGRAEGILKNSLEREHEHKLQLIAMTRDNEKGVLEAKISALSAQVESLQKDLAHAKSEVAKAHEQAQTIAAKALEAASGQTALAATQSAMALGVSPQSQKNGR